MYCSWPGSSIHGIFQSRILDLPFPSPGDLTQGLNPGLPHCRQMLYWVASPFSRNFPYPVFEPRFLALQADSSPSETPGQVPSLLCVQLLSSVQCFAAPWTVAHQALSMEFSRQEYWSGLPLPTPGDLPNPVTESASVDSLPLVPPGKPIWLLDVFFLI